MSKLPAINGGSGIPAPPPPPSGNGAPMNGAPPFTGPTGMALLTATSAPAPRVGIPEESEIRVLPVSLAIGQRRRLNISGVTFLHALRMDVVAAPGDVEIALGPQGEFFPIYQGFTARFTRVNTIEIRNVSGTARELLFLYANDPGVTIWNADGGF